MAAGAFAFPAEWGYLPLSFAAGLVWRPAPQAVHLHCPTAVDCPGSSPRGSGWLGLLLAFSLGLLAGRVWGTLAPVVRFRRAARVPPRPLFD